MARSINFSARLNSTPAELFALFATEEYWQELMKIYHEYTPLSEITKFAVADNTIQLEFKQLIPRSDLPPAAQSVIRSDMHVKRVQTYSLDSPERVSGEFSGSIPAGPGSLKGTEVIVPDSIAGRSIWKRVPTAKVFVPFVGGKLEQIMLVNMVRLFKEEEKFLQNWLQNKAAN